MPTVFSGEARGLKGMKSRAFCSWILEMLGYQEGDVIDDLFPGTGTMQMVTDQGRLAL
jgi:DNA modification methylase